MHFTWLSIPSAIWYGPEEIRDRKIKKIWINAIISTDFNKSGIINVCQLNMNFSLGSRIF